MQCINSKRLLENSDFYKPPREYESPRDILKTVNFTNP